jgi:hypothetical protein
MHEEASRKENIEKRKEERKEKMAKFSKPGNFWEKIKDNF